MEYPAQDVQDAIRRLRAIDWTTDKLLIVIKSVSRSGMTRRMAVYVAPGVRMITGDVARAIGWSFNETGIKVEGCGMDMAFHLADTLTCALYSEDRPVLTGNGGSCIDWMTL